MWTYVQYTCISYDMIPAEDAFVMSSKGKKKAKRNENNIKCSECGRDSVAMQHNTCHAPGCGRKYHIACLDVDIREAASVTISADGDWLCPHCTPNISRICAVCGDGDTNICNTALDPAVIGWAHCSACDQAHHIGCLSGPRQRHANSPNWLCNVCE